MRFEDLKFSDLQMSFSDCSLAYVHQLITEIFDLKRLWEKHRNSIVSVKDCCDDVADCMNLIAGGPNAAQTFLAILRKASDSIKDLVSTANVTASASASSRASSAFSTPRYKRRKLPISPGTARTLEWSPPSLASPESLPCNEENKIKESFVQRRRRFMEFAVEQIELLLGDRKISASHLAGLASGKGIGLRRKDFAVLWAEANPNESPRAVEWLCSTTHQMLDILQRVATRLSKVIGSH